jgi:hypothetical protein
MQMHQRLRLILMQADIEKHAKDQFNEVTKITLK